MQMNTKEIAELAAGVAAGMAAGFLLRSVVHIPKRMRVKCAARKALHTMEILVGAMTDILS